MPDKNQLTWVYYRSGRHSKEASEELAGFLIGRVRPLRANHNTAVDKRIIVQYNIHRSNPREIPTTDFARLIKKF